LECGDKGFPYRRFCWRTGGWKSGAYEAPHSKWEDSYTDTVHGVEETGFYKIEVEMAE